MGNDLQNIFSSPDGRILGKMAHSERTGKYVLQNIPGNMDQKLFASGVRYFRQASSPRLILLDWNCQGMLFQ